MQTKLRQEGGKNMKKSRVTILAAALALALTACGSGEAQTETAVETIPADGGAESPEETAEETAQVSEGTSEAYTFGISMPQLDNDGFKANLIGIEQYLRICRCRTSKI